MRYNLTTPCDECPYLKGSGFTFKSLLEHAAGEFPCHKACDLNKQDEFKENKNGKTPHCAGALIFLEKREEPHQMMRIAERLGMYDHTKLNMKARVVTRPGDCRRTKYNPKKEKRNG